jgi:subtilisin family serine protease
MNTKWSTRVWTILFLIGFVAGTIQPVAAIAAPAESADPLTQVDALDKIEPLVLEQITAAGQTEFFVWMAEKADLSTANQLNRKVEKGQFVFEELRATAERSQRELRATLDAQGVRYRPFYISNKIFVHAGDQALAMTLAARADVAKITPNNQYQLQEPIIERDPPQQILAIESNITFIQAHNVWALGFTGQGTVLAGNDTGLDWDHPAIINHYRGWDGLSADHNYNWWDATGTYLTIPGDGHGHGTHTTGTMVGDDGGANQIGVAPGAQTIHCKNMTDGGSGDDYTFSECFEWDLAPWDLSGANPRPDLAPQAVNNSWGYSPGGYPAFEDEIDALQAAGIVVEVSAGNEGPSCETLRSPGDYAQVLTTGSINHAGGVLPGSITGFSGRGPSSLYPGDYMPDVMAPGENIRSSLPGGGYSSWSGTSMAGPHVTALIGLMWSANPALQGLVAETYDMIHQTAVPLMGQGGSGCGGDYVDGPNNDWGFGTIDALAAVQAALFFGNPGTLQGTVTDSSSGLPIPGAQVTAIHSEGYTFDALTDGSGFYSRMLMEGTYELTAAKYGYLPETVSAVAIVEDTVTTHNFALDPAPSYTVSGTVTDANTGWPLYASIDVEGVPIAPIWTDPVTGEYSMTLVAGMEYSLTANAWLAGYLEEIRSVGPLTGNLVEDFELDVNPVSCMAPGYTLSYTHLQDFETSNGGYVPSGTPADLFQWGEPVTWPSSCTSGENCWGTNLSGNYPNNADAMVTGPVIDLSAASAPLTARWWQALNIESSSYDHAFAEVSVNGGSFVTMWQHTDTTITVPWQEMTYDLSAAAGGTAQFRYRLTSDSSVTYNGYYFDRVAITAADDCQPSEGSLLIGNVYDDNNGVGLNEATVVVDGGDSVPTYPTPEDPALEDGFYTVFAPSGMQTITASQSGYGDESAYLNIPAYQTLQQDFYLEAGRLVADPDSLEATLELGNTTTTTLNLTNEGSADVSFDILEVDQGFIPVGGPEIQNTPPVSTMPARPQSPDPTTSSHTAPGGYLPQQASNSFAGISAIGDTVAVFKDVNAWNTTEVESFLAANSITYEVHNSSEFGSLDFSQFGMIIVSGDQSQTFYDTYASYVSKFEDYVAGGGFLNFFACDYGWNGGTLTAPLPGGMTWTGLIYENYNTIVDPTHPVVQVVPSPFYGTSASHGYFNNLPAGAHVIANQTSGGQPTIVEYPLGDGWLIAFGQPLEFAHEYSQDAGWIMENTLLWGYEFMPGVVPWLSEAPISATLPVLGAQVINVTFDASVVEQPGDYLADLSIENDTPYGPLTVPVTMHVTPPATYGKLVGTVTGLGLCDSDPAPLAGAWVHIEGSLTTWDLETDTEGYYQVWMDASESPLTITVSLPEHEAGYAAGVLLTAGSTTTDDFDLRWLRACFNTDPTSLESTLELGSTSTETFTLLNSGAAEGEFELRERDQGFAPLQQISIPASDGTFPRGAAAPSTGPAPTVSGQADAPMSAAFPLAGAPAFAIDVYPGENLVYIPDTETPGTWNIISSTTGYAPFAGDFINGDFSTLYVLDYTINQLMSVDTSTGAITVIGPSTPYGGESWSGMSGSMGGVMYASSTSTSRSTLYTIDLASGTAAVVGEITNAYCVIDIAISSDDAIYAVDICQDALYSIDPATGAGTLIGSIGFDANYAQGMDFEEETDILYLAAYNNSTGQGELRIADTSTGNTVLVGAFPGGAEVDALAFPTGGVSDVPWLSEDPIAGTVPADSSLVIEANFDAGVVTQPGDYMADIIVANNSPAGSFSLPVTMHVTPPAGWGKLEGTVMLLGYCDVNPQPLANAEVEVTSTGGTSWTSMTDAGGYYTIWLDQAESPLTVHVETPEYEVGDATEVVVTAGETITVDFNLRWLKPCLSAEPSSYEVEVLEGYSLSTTLSLNNDGAAESSFEFRERDLGFTPAGSSRITISVPAGLSGAPVDSAAGRSVQTLPPTSAWEYDDPNGYIAAGARVLIVHADEGDGEPLRTILQGYPDIELVDIYDARSSIPSLTLLEGYDIVITWSNYAYADRNAMGDVLADYVDAGGYVIQATFSWVDTSGWGLGGRFVSESYSPFTSPNVGNHFAYADLGTYDASHPIMQGVSAASDYYRDYVDLTAGAELVASWSDGEEFIATKDQVVAINSYTGIFYAWTGDIGIIFHNAVNYLLSSVDVPWLSEDPISGIVPADSGMGVEVTFDSTGLALGTYSASLLAMNNNPVGGSLEIPVTMHVVAIRYEVELSPDAALSGEPGETVTHAVTITNTGNIEDTFTIELEDGYTWVTQLSDPSFTLAPGASEVVQVQVTIPAGAQGGDQDEVSVTATSQGDPAESASSTLTTFVQALYGVELSPTSTTLSGKPGETLTHEITLTNTGNLEDTFTIDLGGQTWVTVPSSTSVTLAAGASTTVQVQVTIPAGAMNGEYDTVTVTATSQGDPAITASMTMTTATKLQMIYLPVTFSNTSE